MFRSGWRATNTDHLKHLSSVFCMFNMAFLSLRCFGSGVTFGVCIYSLAGLLIVVLLWVLFTSATYVVIATHAG